MKRKSKRTHASDKDEISRRLAEQLSERINSSPEEIQKGVKNFIESSEELLGGAKDKPPYRREPWYEKLFEIIHQRSIPKLSLEFIRHNIISARSEAYKFRNGLRFLDLIDNKGYPTEKLNKLRVTGQEFTKNFEKVIRSAYSDLFRTIIVERAEPESLINYMIERYGYSRPLGEEATVLFTYFCSKAGLTISPQLANFKAKAKKTARKTGERKRVSKKWPEEKREFDEHFATLSFDDFSFRVKKEAAAIKFARSQVNALLDYLTEKLTKEKTTRTLEL